MAEHLTVTSKFPPTNTYTETHIDNTHTQAARDSKLLLFSLETRLRWRHPGEFLGGKRQQERNNKKQHYIPLLGGLVFMRFGFRSQEFRTVQGTRQSSNHCNDVNNIVTTLAAFGSWYDDIDGVGCIGSEEC